MSLQGRNPLSQLLRTQPRWPNPEQSIGEFIGMLQGRDRCWRAAGPALEVFERLAPEIKHHLNACIDSIPGSAWVTWSIYMIGSNRQTARPTVLFCCEELQPRLAVWQAIKKSKILKRYSGLKSGHIAMPPEFEHLEELANSDDDSDASSDSSSGPLIQFSGRRILIDSRDGKSSSRRTATIGGVVYCNGTPYAISAGHVFRKASTDKLLATQVVQDNEYQIESDSDSDDDINSDDEVDFLSKYSATPEDCRSTRSDTSDEQDRIFSRSNSYSNTALRPEELTSYLKAATEDLDLVWFSDKNASPLPLHTTKVFFPSSNVSSFTDTIISKAYYSLDLDYSLIQIPEGVVIPFSTDQSNFENTFRSTIIATGSPRDTSVFTFTASSGLLQGKLSQTPSYTRLPGSSTFQEVYTAQFGDALRKGDCGSWVIEAHTGKLWGHIIAGTERTGTAYIVPAQCVFENVTKLLSCELSLQQLSLPLDNVDSQPSTRKGSVLDALSGIPLPQKGEESARYKADVILQRNDSENDNSLPRDDFRCSTACTNTDTNNPTPLENKPFAMEAQIRSDTEMKHESDQDLFDISDSMENFSDKAEV
jgi:peptide-N4-(N-acetyl-beta-glucosaminyl)asparagine amidase